MCAPAPTGDSAIFFGGEVLRNLDERWVTITGVSLVDAQELTLVGAFLVETRPGKDLVEVGFEHPNGQPPPSDWLAADNAVVRPGEQWNLVLLVTTKAEDTASARAARIEYENASGRRYYQDTITEMLVARRPCHEVLWPDSSPFRGSSELIMLRVEVHTGDNAGHATIDGHRCLGSHSVTYAWRPDREAARHRLQLAERVDLHLVHPDRGDVPQVGGDAGRWAPAARSRRFGSVFLPRSLNGAVGDDVLVAAGSTVS